MAHDELEIERSWVIKALPEKSLVDHAIYHEIGYLFNKDGELRVYKKKLPDKWKYGITVKEDGGLARREWEEKLFPEWAFEVVWPNTTGARVCKTRHFVYWVEQEFQEHFVHHGSSGLPPLLIEIDEYQGNLSGLVRMECEFPSEDEAAKFEVPGWAEGAIEVTHDSRFKNKNLAKLSCDEFLELMESLE